MRILIHIQWPAKAWNIPDTHAAQLYETFPDVEFVRVYSIGEATRAVVDVDAAFTPHMTAEMVANAPKLRWVHSPAAAVEGLLPLEALAARNITVTNSKGVQAIPIAEHVMGGILMLSRKFNRTLDAQREQRWIQNDLVEDWPWLLSGQHMTIVGLGTIGSEIAKRAHAFGIHVTGVRRNVDAPKPSFVETVVGPDHLDDALSNCDLLILSAPGVGSTHRMIGVPQLARLNRGAVLVNVARAGIVDDAAMRRALESGQLGGAVLDVFEREPLDTADGLWSMKNVVLTPHSAGFRASHWDDVTALFTDNLQRYQHGRALLNQVDLAAGY
ncbi:MAG: D-2-hydroxyacid dehydrogenase [Gemmatimonadaceae bacterium]